MEEKLTPSEVKHKKVLREILFKVLYSASMQCSVDDELLEMIIQDYCERKKKQVALSETDMVYIKNKAKNIIANTDDIDDIIEHFLIGWKMERLMLVDLSVLRMSTYDLLYTNDVPENVVISEAVILAGLFSDDKAKSFINGVLGSILKYFNDHNKELNVVLDKVKESKSFS